jgi:hypothetical protein
MKRSGSAQSDVPGHRHESPDGQVRRPGFLRVTSDDEVASDDAVPDPPELVTSTSAQLTMRNEAIRLEDVPGVSYAVAVHLAHAFRIEWDPPWQTEREDDESLGLDGATFHGSEMGTGPQRPPATGTRSTTTAGPAPAADRIELADNAVTCGGAGRTIGPEHDRVPAPR